MFKSHFKANYFAILGYVKLDAILIHSIIIFSSLFLLPVNTRNFVAIASEVKEPYKVFLTDGSWIEDYDWWDVNELVLYAVNPHGAILWLHKIDTYERRKLISATELYSILGSKAQPENIRVSLSPNRRFVAFYGAPNHPLESSFLRVVDLGKKVPIQVSFSKMPDDFVIGLHAWDSTDKYIYVSAREFLSPENEISLGRLSLETGSFMGLTRKSSVDLIESLTYDNYHNALIIVSRSYMGDYPRHEFLLSLDLETIELKKIFEAYQFRGVQVTEKGEILMAIVNPKKEEGEIFPGFLVNPETLPIPQMPEEGKRERLITKIILLSASKVASANGGLFESSVSLSSSAPSSNFQVLLDSQTRGFDFNPYLSPEGNYLLFLRSFYRLPYALKVSLPDNSVFLFLKKRAGSIVDAKEGATSENKSEDSREAEGSSPSRFGDSWSDYGQEFMVMLGVDSYKVSPGEKYLAVRYYDKSHLRLFELPK